MMKEITELMQSQLFIQMELLFRIIVAGICGAFIGVERKNRLKNAGLKTHLLVALTSALMVVISKYGFFDVITQGLSVDASRVAASVASGVGFLGAGLILAGKHEIMGVTTAAGIWATVGVGMALGAGMYFLGISSTLVILFSQFLLHQKFIVSNEYFGERVTVTLLPAENALERFQTMLSQNKFEMSDIKVKSTGTEAMEVRFVVRIRGLHQIGPPGAELFHQQTGVADKLLRHSNKLSAYFVLGKRKKHRAGQNIFPEKVIFRKVLWQERVWGACKSFESMVN